MSNEITTGARRNVARRAAFEALIEAGDPVARAIAAGVDETLRVELTDALVDRAVQAWEKQTGAPADTSGVRALMVVAYEAAGFEVV